jgi:hypothetical protein
MPLAVLLKECFEGMRLQDAAFAAAMAARAEERRLDRAQARFKFNWALLRFVIQLPAGAVLLEALTNPQKTWAFLAEEAGYGFIGVAVFVFVAFVALTVWGCTVDLFHAWERYYHACYRSMKV